MTSTKEIRIANELEGLRNENKKLKHQIFVNVLASKEKEVLTLIALGFSDKEISEMLNISTNTMHTHRKNIMRKLEINNAALLMKFALECGLD